jgi:DNA-binding CsgD family transcriptional regulator
MSGHLTSIRARILREYVVTSRAAVDRRSVTTHTVPFHLRSVYAKLHVHSKTEAVAKALRHRLIK